MATYNGARGLTYSGPAAGFTTGVKTKGILLMPGDSCTVKDIYGNSIGLTSGNGNNAVPFLLPIQISECTAAAGTPKYLF